MVHIFTVVCLAATHVLAASAISPRRSVPHRDTLVDPGYIPEPCATTVCATIRQETLNNCTSATCVCTDTNGNDLQACVDCMVQQGPMKEMNGQTLLSNFNNMCAGKYVGFTPLSLSICSSSTCAASTTTTPPTYITTATSPTTTATSTTPTSTSTSTSTFTTATGMFTPTSTSEFTSGASSSTTTATGALNPSQKSAARKARSGLVMVLGSALVGVWFFTGN